MLRWLLGRHSIAFSRMTLWSEQAGNDPLIADIQGCAKPPAQCHERLKKKAPKAPVYMPTLFVPAVAFRAIQAVNIGKQLLGYLSDARAFRNLTFSGIGFRENGRRFHSGYTKLCSASTEGVFLSCSMYRELWLAGFVLHVVVESCSVGTYV